MIRKETRINNNDNLNGAYINCVKRKLKDDRASSTVGSKV